MECHLWSSCKFLHLDRTPYENYPSIVVLHILQYSLQSLMRVSVKLILVTYIITSGVKVDWHAHRYHILYTKSMTVCRVAMLKQCRTLRLLKPLKSCWQLDANLYTLTYQVPCTMAYRTLSIVQCYMDMYISMHGGVKLLISTVGINIMIRFFCSTEGGERGGASHAGAMLMHHVPVTAHPCFCAVA